LDFSLSEEQEALQEMARDFLRERWPTDRSREGLDKRPAVIDDEVWQEIVEMGWLGVMAPEQAGGIGADVMTAAVLAQEAGRGVLPGPFQSSLVAAIASERSADEALCGKLLPDLIGGKTRATLAIDEPGGLYGPDAVAAEAVAGADGWQLSGCKILVPDAEGSSVLLVAARTPDGLGLVRVASGRGGRGGRDDQPHAPHGRPILRRDHLRECEGGGQRPARRSRARRGRAARGL
jgi:acyl-CoA dehydrogenase